MDDSKCKIYPPSPQKTPFIQELQPIALTDIPYKMLMSIVRDKIE